MSRVIQANMLLIASYISMKEKKGNFFLTIKYIQFAYNVKPFTTSLLGSRTNSSCLTQLTWQRQEKKMLRRLSMPLSCNLSTCCLVWWSAVNWLPHLHPPMHNTCQKHNRKTDSAYISFVYWKNICWTCYDIKSDDLVMIYF